MFIPCIGLVSEKFKNLPLTIKVELPEKTGLYLTIAEYVFIPELLAW